VSLSAHQIPNAIGISSVWWPGRVESALLSVIPTGTADEAKFAPQMESVTKDACQLRTVLIRTDMSVSMQNADWSVMRVRI